MTKLTDKIEDFIKNSISEKKFVFLTEEIDKQVRLFLKKENYLKSPLKGIYVLSHDTSTEKELGEKFFLEIVSRLEGIISGDFVLTYGDLKEAFENNDLKEIFIYGNNNFTKKLGTTKINFRKSTVKRTTRRIYYNKQTLLIEDDISYIINNSKYIEKLTSSKKEQIIKKIANNIILENFQYFIKGGFKISGITYLAKLFKLYGYDSYYKFILKELQKNNKKMNYSKKINSEITKKKDLKNNINSLLSGIGAKN